MYKSYRILAWLLVLSLLCFSSNLLAQNFVGGSASAKLVDRDNNGYANIGDLVNFNIVANNVSSDSINAAVIFQYYSGTDTLYLTRSGGTGPGNTGDGVVFSKPGGSAIQEKAVGNGLNAIKASTATAPSNGILRYLLYKRLGASAGAGPKNILQSQEVILTSDGVFKDTVDNERPQAPTTKTVTLTTTVGNASIAGIGDQLKFQISESGTGGALSKAILFFNGGVNQIQPFTDISPDVLSLVDVPLGNIPYDGSAFTAFAGSGFISMVKNGSNWEATVTLKSGQIEQVANQTTGAYVYIVDQFGNVTTITTFIDNLSNAIDNNIPSTAVIQGNTSLTTTNTTAYRFDNTWGNGPNTFYSAGYITVGSSVTLTVNGVPSDVDTVYVDLRSLGYSSNEKIVRAGATASKTYAISASTSSYMDYSSSSDSGRIPITFVDDAGNSSVLNTATISTFSGAAIKHVDRSKPIAITSGRVTITHTDFDVVNAQTIPSNNNGIINPNERIRIKVDVTNQADFATVSSGTGNIIVDLSAFGYASQIIMNGNVAAPAPNSVNTPGMAAGTNYGYDNAAMAFYIEFVVPGGAIELPANSTVFVIKNVVDNVGNQLNPTNNGGLYQNVTYNKAIDIIAPIINMGATVNSFAFSSSTDVNGDGIAAVNDGVQVNAVVTGADSVFADLRPIGRGIVPMTLGVGNNWSISTITVLQGNDPQWSSDNDFGNTSITIIAQDNAGNRTTATTVALPVDNLVTYAPTVTVTPASGGRFNVRMENGQPATGMLGTLSFANDMTGGTVPNTSYYRVEFDSTGSGTWSLAGNIAYGGSPTTLTSSQSFSQGKVVAFRVIPFDDAGNQGATSITANGVAQTTLPPAVTYEPATGTIVGQNGTSFNVRIDSANTPKITSVTFRARALDIDPGTAGNQPGDWFTVGGAFQVGGVWSLGGITAGSFTGSDASNGYGYQVVALLTDNAVPANTQTEAEALAANGSITVFADDQVPKVYLTSVLTNGKDSTFNGLDNTPAPFLDIKARGVASFRFNITDNLPLNNNTATLSYRISANAPITQTFASLISSGALSVNGNVYTLNINTAPYIATNPSLGIIINDGRGNTNPTFGTANAYGYNFQFSVDDNVPPAFYMLQPYPYTTFGNAAGTGRPQFIVQPLQTDPAGAANFVEGVIEISTDAAFTSPQTVATIFGAAPTAVQVPANISLTSGTKYWVRAVLRDAGGNRSITDPNPVFYDISVPTFTLTLPQSVIVSGVNRVRGTTRVQITSSTSDVMSWSVRSRRIDLDTTNYINMVIGSTQKPFEFNWNTTASYNAYEGYVVLEISGTDNAGNTIPAQYFPVFVDNLSPKYRITAVNGDEEISSFAPMIAGDTLKVRVEVFDNDVAAASFSISNYNASSGIVSVPGTIVQQTGKVYTVHFPLPASSATNVISINPGGGAPVITYTFIDSVGNPNPNYIGSPAIGSVTVIGNQNPAAFISNIQRFNLLRSGVTIRTRTTGMSSISSGNGAVRFEVKRPGSSAFEVLGTDNTEPYTMNLNTTNYSDGFLLLRVVPLDANTVQKEYTPDTLTVIIDNLNNGATERAAIANLGNATIGGQNITLTATAGVDVGGVRFDARYVNGRNSQGTTAAGWINLLTNSATTNTVRNPDGSFSQTFSGEELRQIFANNFGGFGSVSALDGEVEFRAVAEDKAGYDFYVLNNPGQAIPFGTGNVDDPNVVATTRAKFDFTAPSGIATVNNAALTNTQKSAWTSFNNSNFNLLDGSVTVHATVEDVSDFGQTLITLTRYYAVDPGTFTTFYGDGLGEGKEKVVASFSSPTASTYSFNTSSLTRGGLYEMKVYLRDIIGNQQQIERFFFVAGKPQAYVSGYNAEHKVIYLLGQNTVRSARVEYSTDGGTTYNDVGYVNMNGNSFGNNPLDRARFGQISVANITLPAGNALFRVTGSELPYNNPGDFALSRFASLPTTFSLTIGANGSWSPTNIAASNIGITLNHEYGDLSSVRVEVTPQNSNDQVSVTMVGDNVPNVTTNTLSTEFFPRDVNWNFSSTYFGGNQTLTNINGNAFGFNSNVNLFSAFNITAGGTYQAFAANVLPNGAVDMNLQTISLKRIASLQRDSVQSLSGNFIIRFDPNVLTTNAGGYLEEDASKFVSYAAGQLDMGQIGSAYWLRIFNTSGGTASLRAGYRAYVSITYNQADIVDANKDGVIDGADEMLLNIATSGLGSTSFTFNVDVKNKSVDTVNNTVTFTISSMGLQRYMLVLDGANNAQQGSIIAGDIRVSNTTGTSITRSNNFANSSTASFVGVASDFISGINTGTAILLIDGVPVSLGFTTVGGGAIRFTASLGNLGLTEAIHTARFIVENNNGNRLDRKFTFVIDQTMPRVISQSSLFGRDTNRIISFILSDPKTDLKPSAGVDTTTVFVDVYGTKVVKKDSSELAYEIQQFIGRLSPSQLTFALPLDSLKVGFIMNDNLQRADIDGYSLVVHDGTTSLSELLNSNIANGTSTLLSYASRGIFDFAQNQALPMNFRVTADFDGPDIAVVQNILEKGMTFKVTDDKSGVDTSTVEVVEVDEEKGDSTITLLATGLNYNIATGIVTYSAKQAGNLIIVRAADNFANKSEKQFSVESENLAVADFHSYPNPFNPEGRSATITFVLSRASRVTIEAFDWLGRSAGKVIDSRPYSAGRVQAVEFTGRYGSDVLANGVYFLRLTANDGDKADTKYFKAVIAVKKQ